MRDQALWRWGRWGAPRCHDTRGRPGEDRRRRRPEQSGCGELQVQDIRVIDVSRRELTQPSADEWSLRYPKDGRSWHHGDKTFLFEPDL
jgi:hypothetical protein